MNVIYDISVLAQARRYVNARTGIFRVVDNVARGLAASAELDLKFCVSEGTNDPVGFLSADLELGGVGLAVSASTRFSLSLYSHVHRLTDRLSSGSSGVSSASQRALRKGLYHLAEFSSRHGRILRKEDLAVAEIYHSPFASIPREARAARYIKRFLTVYDLIPVLAPEFFPSELSSGIPRILESLSSGDFALCISQNTKNDLCSYRTDLDPAKVFVTPLAASSLFYKSSDIDRLSAARKKYKIPEDGFYLLSLSTLEPRKNIDQLIKCFARLVREQGISNLRLVLVGARGWDYDRIFEAVDRFDVARDYIAFTGYVDDDDLAALYSGALAFVYLSLYEGFGLPPLEAMQCGIPVITSNRSSLPEVVGDAGIMIDPTDEDAVCQSILDVYSNHELRERMGAASIERARQFSWERCTQQTIAAYKFALNN